MLRSSRWVICEKKKVRRRQQTIQSDETYELPPPLSSVMEKGGHCRQVRAHAPSGQRGVDVAALLLLLLLLLAERHLSTMERGLERCSCGILPISALQLRCIISIVGMAGHGSPTMPDDCRRNGENATVELKNHNHSNERGLLRFYVDDENR